MKINAKEKTQRKEDGEKKEKWYLDLKDPSRPRRGSFPPMFSIQKRVFPGVAIGGDS